MLRISGSIYIYIYIYIYISFLSTSTDLFIRAFFLSSFVFVFVVHPHRTKRNLSARTSFQRALMMMLLENVLFEFYDDAPCSTQVLLWLRRFFYS